MEKKVILLNVWKSKKGSIRVGVGIPISGLDKVGFRYSENWYPAEDVNYDYIKNHILDEVVAKLGYKELYDGNAVEVVEALADLKGEIILEKKD